VRRLGFWWRDCVDVRKGMEGLWGGLERGRGSVRRSGKG